MITRVYRVRIKPELRSEFEPLFQTVARASVETHSACTRIVVGGPSPATPDEYAMITDWTSEAGLTAFAGEDWTQAHIPPGMEKFVGECWVHHYHAMPD